jgi:hypothetical protein
MEQLIFPFPDLRGRGLLRDDFRVANNTVAVLHDITREGVVREEGTVHAHVQTLHTALGCVHKRIRFALAGLLP